MHIVLVGPEYYGYSHSIISALEKIGCKVDFFSIDEFYTNCSYWQRKLYKMGVTVLESKWNESWEQKLRTFIEHNATNNSIILFLTGSMVRTELLKDLHAYKKILYMWDSIRRYPKDFQERIKYYDYAFAFEYSDIEYAAKELDTKMEYMPLGYDDNYYYPSETVVKDIDVSFIGTAMPSRLKILEELARFCSSNNIRLYAGGQWYSNNRRKKRSFANKYPNLIKFHDNRMLKPVEVADIYRRSKICLNINNNVHKSISPRTFEIMATQSFQLMNEGQDFSGLVGADEIERNIDTYNSEQSLYDKIQYYLMNDNLRKEKALNGYKNIRLRYSDVIIMKSMLRKVVGE